MAFLSEVGLKKLEDFKIVIQEIFEKKFTNNNLSSEFSKEMLKKMIELIDTIKKYNAEGSLFSIQTLVNQIQPLMLSLDGETNSGVPVIFNEESLSLAMQLQRFLININLKEDLIPTVYAGLSVATLFSSTNLHDLLGYYATCIGSCVMLYQKIFLGKNKIEQSNQLQDKIKKLFYTSSKRDTCFYRMGQTLLDKLKNKEFKESNFKKEYEEQIQELWKQMLNVPYVILFYPYCTDKPHVLNLQEMNIMPLGSYYLKDLQKYELKINETLIQKKWEQVTVVQTLTEKLFSKEIINLRKKQLLDLFKKMEEEIKPHCQKRISFWSASTENRAFSAILQEVSVRKMEAKEGYSSESIMNLYKKIFSADKEISKILNKYEQPLLEFAVERTWGDDEEHYQTIQTKSISDIPKNVI